VLNTICIPTRTRPRVIYVGTFRFPEEDAAAARVLGIGKALRDLGCEVVFGGGEERERPEDLQADGAFRYQGFSYCSQNDVRNRPLPPVQRFLRYLRAGSNTLRWLRGQDTSDVAAIITYHGLTGFVRRLQAFAAERRIPLIHDITEWPDPSQLVGGQFGIVRWDETTVRTILYSRSANIIAISSYLEEYYRRKKCRVIRIPPLVDLSDPKWPSGHRKIRKNDRLQLIYAGSPGKKDLLGNVFRGIAMLKKTGIEIALDLLGPSPTEVADCLGADRHLVGTLGSLITYHGRIPQPNVPRMLAEADFSVVLRPDARYAHAGFPTKLVESLSAGLPILTNATSNITEYVRDGNEGFILRGCSPEDFVEGIGRVLGTPRERWAAMKGQARLRAGECFDYRNYIEPLSAFFDNVAPTVMPLASASYAR